MRSLLIAAALAAIVCAAAVGAPSLAGVDPTGAQITFWYQHSAERDTAMQALLAEFNRTNPWKITVHGEYAGPYDQIYNKMVAAIAAGNTPELVVAYQNQSATYAVSNAIVDLDPYVHDPTWGVQKDLGDFIAGFINQDYTSQFGGMRLGFPPNRSIEILYSNTAMLKAAGIAAPARTWDEFYADCQKVTSAQKGTYGYALDNLDASHVFSFVISRGGSFTTPDGTAYRLDTPEMKDTFLYMRKLLTAGLARKIAKKYDDQTEFGNGAAAFAVGSTSGIPYYGAAVKAGRGGAFDWGIGPVPQSTTSRPPAIDLYGASVSVTRTTPKKQLAAWLFIRWFSEARQQAAWTHESLYFPVRRSAEPLIADILKSDPRFATAWELLKTADLKGEPPFAGYDLVRDAISSAYSRVLDGADVDSTLAALQAQAQKILKDSSP